MVLRHERDFETSGPWQSAATLAGAIVMLGLAMSWPLEQVQTAAAGEHPSAAVSCAGADEVSNFICRNGWLADLEHNYR